MNDMDISNFMSWFVAQCVSIFGAVYSTLDSITFLGTSLLKVSLTILILSAIVGVFFTLPNPTVVNSERSKNVKDDDYEPKHAKKYEPKHAKKGYEPRHGKS